MSSNYRIRVSGRVGPELSQLLDDLAPRPDDGSTVLHADDADQAALHGVLGRLRDLGLEILSVARTDVVAS